MNGQQKSGKRTKRDGPPAKEPATDLDTSGAPDIQQLWASFWDWVGARPGGLFIFRGQGDKSPIIPKIGRNAYAYQPAYEKDLHNAFVRAARSFVPTPLASDWEWLALAQHQGAPTRLADWSTSPLVAAWFAVTSYPEDKDAAIFALELTREDLETLDIRRQDA
jgi:FRG domain